MKKSVILCCVTCCLLSAFPENQGSKLKDSLYCVMQFSKSIVTCSWSESRISRQFVNMTLMEINRSHMCETMEPVIITPTHLNWTCHKNYTWGGLYNEIHLIFVPDRSLESCLNVSNEGECHEHIRIFLYWLLGKFTLARCLMPSDFEHR